MTKHIKSAHTTNVGDNIFLDLGFSPKEAAALHAKSKKIISKKMAIKESLMTELSTWIDERNLKQHDAAIILGVSRPRVSDVVHKKTVKFTIDALVDMLARAGKQVEFAVR